MADPQTDAKKGTKQRSRAMEFGLVTDSSLYQIPRTDIEIRSYIEIDIIPEIGTIMNSLHPQADTDGAHVLPFNLIDYQSRPYKAIVYIASRCDGVERVVIGKGLISGIKLDLEMTFRLVEFLAH
jgi:hypothetical protein